MGKYTATAQALLASTLKKNRDRVFVKMEGQSMTYADLDRRSNRVANAMAGMGYGPNDRVVIIMPNCLEYTVINMGLVKTGVTLLALNIMLSEREIAFILKDSGVKAAFVDQMFFDLVTRLKEGLPDLKHVIAIGGQCPEDFIPYEELTGGRSESDLPLNAVEDDQFLISYTGGTTGTPKGVVHIQSNLFYDFLAHCVEFNWGSDETILLMTPLSHAAGLFMWVGMIRGATHVIERKFDPFRALELIEKEKITMTFMVPTIMYVLLDILKQKPFDIASLRTILYGAAPITEKRLAEALNVFGPVLFQVYGQTECPNMITSLPPSDHLRALENPAILQSCGRPVMMTSLRILDREGHEVPVNSVGEIAVRAPYVMKGYNNKPEETAAAFTADGWLLTGDMGRVDEQGYVYIVDRKKDMIISGGMNVYSVEVEEVIQKHPKVRQVAVIGVPDDHWGEAVTAVVVAGEECAGEEIMEFCRDRMARYMQPKKVIFTDRLPVTTIGKIDKVELRAPFWAGRGKNVN